MDGPHSPSSSGGVASLPDDDVSVDAASTRTGSCPSVSSSWGALQTALPRILIVSRRHMRKDKFVDFVGEYHLTLILRYGACPVIVPRCVGTDITPDEVTRLIDAYEPVHGVLLCEGEDIDLSAWPGALGPDDGGLSPEQAAAVAASHPSDAEVDVAKDLIEFELVRRCTARGIPYLGICRGSQLLNVYRGGSLYSDIDTQVAGGVCHINYSNYDGHRHPVSVTPSTPLADWFDNASTVDVNSYHHQGVRSLAAGLSPMAHSPDGLIEAFYDTAYDPDGGRYMVGLQFHPERMQNASGVYDYPGCVGAYESFGRAVRAYARQVGGGGAPPEQVEAAPEVVPPPVAEVTNSSRLTLDHRKRGAGVPALATGNPSVAAAPKPQADATATPAFASPSVATPSVASPVTASPSAASGAASSGASSAMRRARSSPASPRAEHEDAPPASTSVPVGPKLSARVTRAHWNAVKTFDLASAMYRSRRASEAAAVTHFSRGASLLAATASPALSLHATVHGGCAARDALGDLYCSSSFGVEAPPPPQVDAVAQLETAVVAAAAALARMSSAELVDAADTLRGLVGVADRLRERGQALEGGAGRSGLIKGGLSDEEEESLPQACVAAVPGVKA
ncbi:hypothetical protein MMPV_001962 [Pyropia vietnamensis]